MYMVNVKSEYSDTWATVVDNQDWSFAYRKWDEYANGEHPGRYVAAQLIYVHPSYEGGESELVADWSVTP